VRFEEVSATVAQRDDDKRSKPGRVLRAADVIPPFDKSVSPANEPGDGEKEPTLLDAREQQPKREPKAHRMQKTGSGDEDKGFVEQPAVIPVIPTYDLAGNILAEHRQAASKRRKAPGQGQSEPEIRPEPAAGKTHVIAPPSQDLADLQRVVAEIVAQDIERLCRRPSRPPQ
jgi:hypothetical protein